VSVFRKRAETLRKVLEGKYGAVEHFAAITFCDRCGHAVDALSDAARDWQAGVPGVSDLCPSCAARERN
jgi:hypothetical protein